MHDRCQNPAPESCGWSAHLSLHHILPPSAIIVNHGHPPRSESPVHVLHHVSCHRTLDLNWCDSWCDCGGVRDAREKCTSNEWAHGWLQADFRLTSETYDAWWRLVVSIVWHWCACSDDGWLGNHCIGYIAAGCVIMMDSSFNITGMLESGTSLLPVHQDCDNMSGAQRFSLHITAYIYDWPQLTTDGRSLFDGRSLSDRTM